MQKPTFALTGASRHREIVASLRRKSALPLVAMELWFVLCQRAVADTGEVLATRDELAEEVDTTADDVSRIMSELEQLGAVSRRREKVRGMRGPGRAVYYVTVAPPAKTAGNGGSGAVMGSSVTEKVHPLRCRAASCAAGTAEYWAAACEAAAVAQQRESHKKIVTDLRVRLARLDARLKRVSLDFCEERVRTQQAHRQLQEMQRLLSQREEELRVIQHAAMRLDALSSTGPRRTAAAGPGQEQSGAPVMRRRRRRPETAA